MAFCIPSEMADGLCIERRPEKSVPEFVAAMCTEGDEVQGSIVDFRRTLQLWAV